mgnify:CR=1 FL=1
MVAELGFFSLILSLGLALVLMLLPAWGVFSRNLVLMQTGGSISAGLFVFLFISFVALTHMHSSQMIFPLIMLRTIQIQRCQFSIRSRRYGVPMKGPSYCGRWFLVPGLSRWRCSVVI